MKVYYIHWSYPATADDQVYYSGSDDDLFFHKRENALKRAEELMEIHDNLVERWKSLDEKKQEDALSQGEEEEMYELSYEVFDSPNHYIICEKEIKFGD